MRKIVLFLGFAACLNSLFADVFVRGHYRGNGTYVQPHYRSNPNGLKHDNWSTKGNINPYTGERGKRTYETFPSQPLFQNNFRPRNYDYLNRREGRDW